jgi:excisionase family DNA binding protein
MTSSAPTAAPALVPLAEVAAIFGVHVQTVRRAVRRGEIPTVRIGQREYVTRRYVDSIIDPLISGPEGASDGRAT